MLDIDEFVLDLNIVQILLVGLKAILSQSTHFFLSWKSGHPCHMDAFVHFVKKIFLPSDKTTTHRGHCYLNFQ
jgi:hypothetical protein